MPLPLKDAKLIGAPRGSCSARLPGVVSAIRQMPRRGYQVETGPVSTALLAQCGAGSNFYVPVASDGDDPNPKVTEFNKTYKAATGGDPSSQYVYPGFGPRTFTPEIHHQNRARYLIVDTEGGKPKVVDSWTISQPIPVSAPLKN